MKLKRPLLPDTMAAIVRPTLLQQQCLITAARRTFTTQAMKSASLGFNASSFRSQSIVPQPSLRLTSLRSISPTTLRVAGFHATGSRPILPAGPRKSLDARYMGLQLTLPTEVIDGTGNWSQDLLTLTMLIPSSK